jgi:hypothetical protein
MGYSGWSRVVFRSGLEGSHLLGEIKRVRYLSAKLASGWAKSVWVVSPQRTEGTISILSSAE